MTRLIAHRGLKKDAKENSLEAFRKALESNEYAGFECDVRTSKDGVFVIVHNPLVGPDIIRLTSFKELQEKYQLPSLEQVLQLKSDKIFLLEVKESDIDVLKFQELIHRYPTKNIYVMSFSNKVISRFINGKQHEKLGVLNYVLNSEEDYQEYDFICLLESVVSSKLLFFFESLHMETFIYGIHHFAKTKEEYKTAYLITDEVI